MPKKLDKLKELFGANPILLQSINSKDAKCLFRKIAY